MCVGCFLSMTRSTGSLPVESFVYVEELGQLPTCCYHDELCQSCGLVALPHRGHWDATLLEHTVSEVEARDTDSAGNLVDPPGSLCRSCRISSLRNQLRNILTRIAGGGPVRGLANPFLNYRESLRYMHMADGTAFAVAHRVIEIEFLRRAVGERLWRTLVTAANHLQDIRDTPRFDYVAWDGEPSGLVAARMQLHAVLFPLEPTTKWLDDRAQMDKVWVFRASRYRVGEQEESSYEMLDDRVSIQMAADSVSMANG